MQKPARTFRTKSIIYTSLQAFITDVTSTPLHITLHAILTRSQLDGRRREVAAGAIRTESIRYSLVCPVRRIVPVILTKRVEIPIGIPEPSAFGTTRIVCRVTHPCVPFHPRIVFQVRDDEVDIIGYCFLGTPTLDVIHPHRGDRMVIRELDDVRDVALEPVKRSARSAIRGTEIVERDEADVTTRATIEKPAEEVPILLSA